jgi:hypothetical protein
MRRSHRMLLDLAVGVRLAGGAVWYRSGGAPQPLAVYQPKGAASLATSYVNLANPGTYDLAPGVAPTFDTTTGWTFNGTTQYLVSGIVPATGWSALVRFSNAGGAQAPLIGARDANDDGLFMQARGTTNRIYSYGGNRLTIAGEQASGVMAIAGTVAYLNGVAETGTLPGTPTTTQGLYVGALNSAGAPLLFLGGKIQAIAIYSVILTGPQVAVITTAMNTLV